LYNDPDYYQVLLQEKSLSLIKDMEELKENSSPAKDKRLVLSLPKVPSYGDYKNPYLKIKKFVRIQNDVRDFFDELDNGRNRLEQLDQQRLGKSLENDPKILGFTIAVAKKSITQIIDCNLEYLEAERISK
jgi:hypothetical protein